MSSCRDVAAMERQRRLGKPVSARSALLNAHSIAKIQGVSLIDTKRLDLVDPLALPSTLQSPQRAPDHRSFGAKVAYFKLCLRWSWRSRAQLSSPTTSDVILISVILISSLPLALEVEYFVAILLMHDDRHLLDLNPHLWKVLLGPCFDVHLLRCARNDIMKESQPVSH